MSEEILINVTPQETRVALMSQGVVQEIHIERSASRGLAGNVHLGKVARVLPGMQSAFIDIGLERAAFLHVADIWEVRQTHHGGNGANSKAAPRNTDMPPNVTTKAGTFSLVIATPCKVPPIIPTAMAARAASGQP